MTECRKLHEAGVLAGRQAGEKVRKLTAEQTEIARLRRQMDMSEGQLKKTNASLGIMGKLSAFFENAIRNHRTIRRSDDQEEMMGTYRQLIAVAKSTRQAAALVGVSLTTFYRKPAAPQDRAPVVPPNNLSASERAEILTALNSPAFVDLVPLQVYAKLLDAGIYLGLSSTFYPILEENQQVKERRRLARHPGWDCSGFGGDQTMSGL